MTIEPIAFLDDFGDVKLFDLVLEGTMKIGRGGLGGGLGGSLGLILGYQYVVPLYARVSKLFLLWYERQHHNG